jgi:uncharacterized protein
MGRNPEGQSCAFGRPTQGGQIIGHAGHAKKLPAGHPLYLNLMLDEINRAARKANNTVITPQHIDDAFDKVVKNSDHFKEWKNRLANYFTKEEAAFLMETLVYIAHRNEINPRQLYDLAVKHNKKDTYMELIRNLEHDGYITELGDRFVFISPFLQAFWKRDNPVYEA